MWRSAVVRRPAARDAGHVVIDRHGFGTQARAGDYLTDGRRLYRVCQHGEDPEGKVVLEDCRTLRRQRCIERDLAMRNLRLVHRR